MWRIPEKTATRRLRVSMRDRLKRAHVSRDRVIGRLRGVLKELKVKQPPRPVNDRGKPLNPVLPPNLTLLNDEELGELHSQFSCMAQWAQLSIAIYTVEAAVAKRNDKIVRAKVRLMQSGTRDDKTDKMEIDEETLKAAEGSLVHTGVELLSKALLEGYIIGRDAVSREYTRRYNLERDRRPL